MSDSLLRQYERWECLGDGYPQAWSKASGVTPNGTLLFGDGVRLAATITEERPAIKHLIREQAGHRCLRCGHPYRSGDSAISERGEWSPCDEGCGHGGPFAYARDGEIVEKHALGNWASVWALEYAEKNALVALSQWRILTVHHLDEDKANCRWWNLVALCQRCHLRMQRAVVMGRPYHYEHSEWFKPYAAGFYAFKYLDEDLSREETMARLDELLALEHRFTQEALL